MERITLREFAKALSIYVEKYGDEELVSIGVSSELDHTILLQSGEDIIGNYRRLPIAQYKDKYSREFEGYKGK